MQARKSGDIIVTSSIAGHEALPMEPVYSASKHAINAFVYGLRRQLIPDNIRVGAVAPGTVLNELWGITEDPRSRGKWRIAPASARKTWRTPCSTC